MARVSKQRLTKKHLDTLFTQLNKTVAALNTKQAGQFFSELLGPEEQIMLAKRLAVIVMTLEGHSLYKTARTLKVSPSTAEKIRDRIDDGSYNGLVSLLKRNKENYLSILETIDSILHLGGVLPHYGDTRIF